MTISLSPNPTASISLSTNTRARFSSIVALDWASIINAPDLDAIEDLTTTGLVTRTGSGAWTTRTLQAPAAGLTITNPAGLAGEPTFAFANDLAALEGLGSTGIAVRTTTDTWAQRTITGTANEITATNGDGVSGNPTLSLPSALTFTGKTVTGGTYNSVTLGDPTIDDAITWTSGGSSRIAQSVGSSQNVMTIVGQGNSKTASIHLNPGSGTLATDTVAEYVLQRTADQAFGSNYGRVSLSALGSGSSNIDTLHAEYGGTVTPVRFDFGIGIENPASTFTSYNFMSLGYASGGSESSQQGAVWFGNDTQTAQRNQISLVRASIGSAGTRDSHAVLWEGKANDGTERAVWWREYVDVISNAGASTFTWQSNLNGAGWNTRMSLTDGGGLTVPTVIGGSGVGSSLSLRSTTGSGTTDAIVLQMGNNGATEAARFVNSSGTIRLGLGTANPTPTNASTITPIMVLSSTGLNAAMQFVRHTAPGGGGSQFILSSTRGGDANSYTTLQSGDGVGTISFNGTDGTQFQPAALIQVIVDAAVSTNNVLGKISLKTSPGGSNTTTQGLSIDSKQNVAIGTEAAALATTATDGFLYIPTCAGTPTGTPTAKTGLVPIVFDTTNNELYVYDGGWISTTAFS